MNGEQNLNLTPGGLRAQRTKKISRNSDQEMSAHSVSVHTCASSEPCLTRFEGRVKTELRAYS